jgi:hypothetical protein
MGEVGGAEEEEGFHGAGGEEGEMIQCVLCYYVRSSFRHHGARCARGLRFCIQGRIYFAYRGVGAAIHVHLIP